MENWKNKLDEQIKSVYKYFESFMDEKDNKIKSAKKELEKTLNETLEGKKIKYVYNKCKCNSCEVSIIEDIIKKIVIPNQFYEDASIDIYFVTINNNKVYLYNIESID
jgi:deoxycytidylate deaminase